jgi:high affinity Mn2+ porin
MTIKTFIYGLFFLVLSFYLNTIKLSAESDVETVNLSPQLSFHSQITVTEQGHPAFASLIPPGTQSMTNRTAQNETTDLTLFLGIKISDIEIYFNPEIDQGFGLSNSLGLAGYSNGEAFKVGQYSPYYKTQRLFARYSVDLEGDPITLLDNPNQLAGIHSENNVIITFGKFSVVDIFDTNSYAHDPKSDFLNWSINDMGAFDYAADSWGYSYGLAIELNQNDWSFRNGLFNMSRKPNSKYLTRGLGQFQIVSEYEKRGDILSHPFKIKTLLFLTSAKIGSYDSASYFSEISQSKPDISLFRHHDFRYGGGLNFEQDLFSQAGFFMRASINDGHTEAYDFTDINQSLSSGFVIKGFLWRRSEDSLNIGGVINAISTQARKYFAQGGLGLLIGDDQLPSYAPEKILEVSYKYSFIPPLNLTLDYQHAINPAYNSVRGPINIFAARLHWQY